MRQMLTIALALTALVAQPAFARTDCSELRILETSPLAFGQIIVPEGEGGVVVLSASGAVATLGQVGSGHGAEPGLIRICGPVGTKFMLLFDTDELNLAGTSRSHRPHVIRDIEIIARGAQVHPSGAARWSGVLGGRGEADIYVGGALTIPPDQPTARFTAPFRISVIPAE